LFGRVNRFGQLHSTGRTRAGKKPGNGDRIQKMQRLPILLGAALFAVAGHAMQPAQPPVAQQAVRITPRQAVMAAADVAPNGVGGIFAMRVSATGRAGERVYLNSEADYRDQRNLTINIAPEAARALARRHEAQLDVVFRGHRIEVQGVAQRTRIDFLNSRRRPTGLYYYQTQVAVDDADQIRIVD
jgi:hypothetical protein